MEISFSMVPGGGLAGVLSDGFRGAQNLGIASAYMTQGGLDQISRSIESALERGGKAAIIHGADAVVTDPGVIGRLNSWSGQYPNLHYRIRLSGGLSARPLFHPKFYWSEQPDGMNTCVVGSSNLTVPGLSKNIEVNAVIRGPSESESIQECRHAFDGLLSDSSLISPGDGFLGVYREIHRQERLRQERRRGDNVLAGLYADLDKAAEADRLKIISSWRPKTQLDVVVIALQRAGPDAELHLREIFDRAWQVAEEFGLSFSRQNWQHSLRRCLNTNTLGKPDGRRLFERVGGEASASGIYRLSGAGFGFRGS